MDSLPHNNKQQQQQSNIGDTMNLFKELKNKEVICARNSVLESAKDIAKNRRLGVCVFDATGLACFCYATGTYTIDCSKYCDELIEVRCVCDESIKLFTDKFFPLTFCDSPKVIFKLGDGQEVSTGRVMGFDFETQECLIYELNGCSNEILRVHSSSVCLLSNIDGWGE